MAIVWILLGIVIGAAVGFSLMRQRLTQLTRLHENELRRLREDLERDFQLRLDTTVKSMQQNARVESRPVAPAVPSPAPRPASPPTAAPDPWDDRPLAATPAPATPAAATPEPAPSPAPVPPVPTSSQDAQVIPVVDAPPLDAEPAPSLAAPSPAAPSPAAPSPAAPSPAAPSPAAAPAVSSAPVTAAAAAPDAPTPVSPAQAAQLCAQVSGASPEQRAQIAAQLGEVLSLGGGSAAVRVVPTLVKLVGDRTATVRVAAIQALQGVTDAEAIAALTQALRDPSPAVMRAASTALQAHKGKPIPVAESPTERSLPPNAAPKSAC